MTDHELLRIVETMCEKSRKQEERKAKQETVEGAYLALKKIADAIPEEDCMELIRTIFPHAKIGRIPSNNKWPDPFVVFYDQDKGLYSGTSDSSADVARYAIACLVEQAIKDRLLNT